ncbi:MAG TPA: ADP-ribosylglycohydrolase family protein, partial [Phormidium sp.]
MRYSLLSRFRGAFLGTVFGEILGAYDDSWQLGTIQGNQKPSSTGRLVVRGTEGLIRRGRLDLADWCEASQSAVQEESEKHRKKLAKETTFTDINTPAYPGITRANDDIRAIISAVPVALFFHEDEANLRQNLQQVADVWQDDSVLKDGTLAIGYAIALALKEKLDPHTLIEEVINYLDVETSLVQQLRQV